MLRYAMAATGLALSACTAMGVDSAQVLRDEFEAPVSYREAYLRARAQAELCLRGESQHQVEGAIDEAGQGGQVYVRAPFTTSRLARVDIRPLDESRSQVRVAMWGVNIWNLQAMHAMRDAVLIGVPSCRSYMPVDHGSKLRRP